MTNIIASRKKYEIKEMLGEGLSSRVYKAICSDNEGFIRHEVALKVLKSKIHLKSWKLAFSKLTKVRSNYCVSIYSWESLEGLPALSMEYVEGCTLKTLVNSGRMTKSAARELVYQVYKGLEVLAAGHLCHGDLSPNNILIRRDGQVKLIDYGLAISGADGVFITPEFAAPEVLEGEPPSFFSDLYSLEKIKAYCGLPVNKDSFHPIKENRGFIRPKSVKLGRRHLAECVQILRHEAKDLRTLPLVRPKKIRFAKVKLVLVAAFTVLVSWPHGRAWEPNDLGFLSIGSHRWCKVLVTGFGEVYTPLFRLPLQSGEYRIEQNCGGVVKETSLTILKGQHIVIKNHHLK